jgi:hypothetical protein
LGRSRRIRDGFHAKNFEVTVIMDVNGLGLYPDLRWPPRGGLSSHSLLAIPWVLVNLLC